MTSKNTRVYDRFLFVSFGRGWVFVCMVYYRPATYIDDCELYAGLQEKYSIRIIRMVLKTTFENLVNSNHLRYVALFFRGSP